MGQWGNGAMGLREALRGGRGELGIVAKSAILYVCLHVCAVVQGAVVQCCAVLCSVVQCSAVQCSVS
jgi:hypothetical protein